MPVFPPTTPSRETSPMDLDLPPGGTRQRPRIFSFVMQWTPDNISQNPDFTSIRVSDDPIDTEMSIESRSPSPPTEQPASAQQVHQQAQPRQATPERRGSVKVVQAWSPKNTLPAGPPRTPQRGVQQNKPQTPPRRAVTPEPPIAPSKAPRALSRKTKSAHAPPERPVSPTVGLQSRRGSRQVAKAAATLEQVVENGDPLHGRHFCKSEDEKDVSGCDLIQINNRGLSDEEYKEFINSVSCTLCGTAFLSALDELQEGRKKGEEEEVGRIEFYACARRNPNCLHTIDEFCYRSPNVLVGEEDLEGL